jgi:hypothetical protein
MSEPDVVYGAAIAALDETPVVVQVPDFKGRFWVYQVVDLRADGFAEIGAMYGTQPGFYLLVGPDWNGEVPKGITRVFRAKTGTAFVVPRVFMDDTAEDRQAVQAVIAGIDLYPLAQFDGKIKTHDWRTLPKLRSPTGDDGSGETKWVFPAKFFDELPLVLKDAPPLPGEEARYAWFDEVEKARWSSAADVKRSYATASIVSADRIVFNIKGNDYRLLVAVDFEKSIVWIKWVGTHRGLR